MRGSELYFELNVSQFVNPSLKKHLKKIGLCYKYKKYYSKMWLNEIFL